MLSMVFFTGCSDEKSYRNEETWQVSPTFTIPKPGPDGKSIQYGLQGNNGEFAISEGVVQAGINNKRLLHFWGETPEKTEQLFNKKVEVIGTKGEDGVTVTAFEGEIGIPNEDIVKPPHHYAVSVGYLNLPSKGTWKLDAYVDEQLLHSIVIEVQ
ncbi:hypothetical protein [Paenibacillus mucilaginosus]|uniref:hypothetical protein n=1 Tax=Paenibacillus mucilaginosus TaxID=61624 RepID=UPI003D1BF840